MSRSSLLLVGLLVLSLGIGAYPPEDPILLVANKNGNSLYVINGNTLAVTDCLPTGDGPHEVAAAPETERAYVANYGEGTVSVIDVTDRRVIEKWPLEGYERPHGIEVGPDEEHVYVTVEDKKSVVELDAASGKVRRAFFTGRDVTHMLAVTSDASTLYATSIGSGTLTRIDLETGRVVSNITTGDGAEGLALTPNDESVWVTNRGEDTVTLYDTASGSLSDPFPVEGFPIRVDVGPSGRHALVSSARAGAVTLFDAGTREQLARLETGAMPIGVLIASETRAFVANAGAGTVSVLDLNRRAITDTISAGRGPDGMAYLPAE